MVETVLALDLPSESRVVEVGVGSGCIGITLALERPRWRVGGSDISPLALEIANENARRLGASFALREGDLLSPFVGEVFDLVVSNPPYIEISEALALEVRDWEPPEALFADEDGLRFYRRLTEEAPALLEPDGWLTVEVGHTQATRVGDMLARHGWREVETTRDLSGIERVVRARRPCWTGSRPYSARNAR
ncbi:peptide chain release factor N(5)-glutamine methyltransferase [bacterium]|nr:MAG: peptide chain release factor N(5)-glutamine methyltransferase [bacterium]